MPVDATALYRDVENMRHFMEMNIEVQVMTLAGERVSGQDES